MTDKAARIIRGGLLADASLRRARPADILIIDDTIAEIGSPGLAAPEDAEFFDGTGFLMHPGLVNAHMHSHGGLARGQGDKWTLELLLTAAPWIGGGRALADKKLSATICAAEMVLKGCTTAYDLFAEVPLPTREGLDAVAEAYATVGLRAVVAPMVADLSFYQAIPGLLDALPDDLQAAADTLRPGGGAGCLAAIEDIARHWAWDRASIRLAVAPTIPHHCTEEFILGCGRIARDHGLRLHTHIAESKVQALVGQQRYGRSLLQQMDCWGLVDNAFTAAHGVWLDDDDMALMADRGATLAHNPGSNMRLGNGLFPLHRALDRGVVVGLGTDGANCSDNQNMYEAMRYASMASKVQSPRTEDWAGVEEIYAAATCGGSRTLGLQDVGEIRPGAKADIVFLDLGAINWIPHNATVNQLVHVEDGTSVRHVMIGGKLVVRNGRLTTVDVAHLAREVEAARDRLEQTNRPLRALTDRLATVVGSFCPGLAGKPYHVHRYVQA